MFLAFDGFHSPVLRSKSPGAQSVTIPWATGVLFRSDVPPHWFQSPGLIVGLWSAVSGLSFVAFSSAGFTPAGLASVGVSPFGKAGAGALVAAVLAAAFLPAVLSFSAFSSAGFTPGGLPSVGVSPFGTTGLSPVALSPAAL